MAPIYFTGYRHIPYVWVDPRGLGPYTFSNPTIATSIDLLVPLTANSATIYAWGAGGGGGISDTGAALPGGNGGGGGFVQTTVPVTAGEILTIVVGEGGKARGGASDRDGGGGGGYTGVFRNGNPIVIAGAGGGGGGTHLNSNNFTGGAGGGGGGYIAGSGGVGSNLYFSGTGGLGASQLNGGLMRLTASSYVDTEPGEADGRYYGGDSSGSQGSAATGGEPGGGGGGAGGTGATGGGGGAGYFGGSSGASGGNAAEDNGGGGGGGSNYATGVSILSQQGSNTGTRAPGNTSASYYNGTAGYGGKGAILTDLPGTNGANGQVTLVFSTTSVFENVTIVPASSTPTATLTANVVGGLSAATGSNSNVTFSAVNIGTASNDRIITVFAQLVSSAAITGTGDGISRVVIDGVDATPISGTPDYLTQGFYVLPRATGTTANIVVWNTAAATGKSIRIFVYDVKNANTANGTANARIWGHASALGQNNATLRITTNNSLVIFGHGYGAVPSAEMTWSNNGTLVIDSNTSINSTFSTANSVIVGRINNANGFGLLRSNITQASVPRIKISWINFEPRPIYSFPDNTSAIDYEMVFTSNSNFVVPAGISTISILAIGGGGAGGGVATSAERGSPGAGGALAYVNSISVTPGETLTVVVGQRGLANNNAGKPGGNSYVRRASTDLVHAGGGMGGFWIPTTPGTLGTANGGSVIVGTGGAGGIGPGAQGGGGGAGGYAGNGGNGASGSGTGGAPATGSGGGAGGGRPSLTDGGGGGGGVGIYGIGADGVPSNGSTPSTGGSGGGSGQAVGTSDFGGYGGDYGGGGGATEDATAPQIGGNGGNGVVRIIWSTYRIREFPSSGVEASTIYVP